MTKTDERMLRVQAGAPFTKSWLAFGRVFYTGKQKHAENLWFKNPLVSAAISFSPTQIDAERIARSIGSAHTHTDAPGRPLTLSYTHRHTHKQN